MDRAEARYRVTAALLQATTPLPLSEIVSASDVNRPAVLDALWELAEEGLAVEDHWLADEPGPQYCWASRLQDGSLASPERLGLDCEAARAFHDFVLNRYRPPEDKKFLVFFQCAVRRPFSSSPSQAFMRRAVSVATGLDPARDFRRCPVHVVVLASMIGPAPYEFEDTYPVNVRAGGVKHFSDQHYASAKPVLAQRMADYLLAHGKRYKRVAAFTQGRYADVMREACRLAGVEFPIFPERGGPRVTRLGDSIPRTYWQRYWIQLCLEIMAWLSPQARTQAEARLDELGVEYEDG